MWNFVKSLFKRFGNYALSHVLPAALLLVVGLIVIRIIMKLVGKVLEKSKLEKAAHTLIKSVIRVGLYLLLMLTAASALGIDITGVVALASVLTLAISLALQNSLANVVGGFVLLSNNPFDSGDYVEIAGQSGTVEEIGLTYTRLKTPDNKTVSIPNNSVVSAEIVNFTTAGTRRVNVTVSASYDAPVEQVLEVLREAGDVQTRLADKEPFAAVSAYNDSSITYLLHVWCKSGDYWTTNCEVHKRVKTLFDEHNIAMPYPHLKVHMEGEK